VILTVNQEVCRFPGFAFFPLSPFDSGLKEILSHFFTDISLQTSPPIICFDPFFLLTLFLPPFHSFRNLVQASSPREFVRKFFRYCLLAERRWDFSLPGFLPFSRLGRRFPTLEVNGIRLSYTFLGRPIQVPFTLLFDAEPPLFFSFLPSPFFVVGSHGRLF